MCGEGYEPNLHDLAVLHDYQVPQKAKARGNLHNCKLCDNGYYKDLKGDYRCKECPGRESSGDDPWWARQYDTDGRILEDGEVITSDFPRNSKSTCKCPSGRQKGGPYTDANHYTYCEKTECSAGQQKVDGWCYDCPVGTYGNGSECNDCEKNTYNGTVGASECLECGINKYTTNTKSIAVSQCLSVPSGKQINTVTKDLEDCDVGTYYDAATSSSTAGCKTCDAGEWQDQVGKSSCKPHTNCEAFNKESTGGTNNADVTCGQCSSNYIKSDFDDSCIRDTSSSDENNMLIQSSKYRTDKVFQFCPPGWYKTEVDTTKEQYTYPCSNYWQNEIDNNYSEWENGSGTGTPQENTKKCANVLGSYNSSSQQGGYACTSPH